MAGRYGPDQLGIATLALSFALGIAAQFVSWLAIPAYLLMFFFIYRFISHDLGRRRRENDWFIRVWWPVRHWFRRVGERLRSRRDYRFFRCPACGNTLRVPKGKGRIKITCPKCGERFERKT